MNNNNFFTVLARQLSSNMNGCACETEDTEMGFNRQLFFKTFTGFWEDDNVADSNSLVTSFYPTQDCKDAYDQRAGSLKPCMFVKGNHLNNTSLLFSRPFHTQLFEGERGEKLWL